MGKTCETASRPEVLDFDEVASDLDDGDGFAAWREDFAASAAILRQPELAAPTGSALRAWCRRLGFDEPTTQALLANRASWDEPAVRRLGAHVQWLLLRCYDPEGVERMHWPAAPVTCPLLYAYALLGLLEGVTARQRVRAIRPRVTTDTLWDIGNQIALHQRIYGQPGLEKVWWLAHHVNDHLFQLGRLQFQRRWVTRAGEHLPVGAAYLDVHVPERGPLDPTGCDRAFDAALGFFARHFAGDGAQWFACTSWLLDPRLADVLPADSNIVRFQRRFDIVRIDHDEPSRVFEFVAHRPDLDRASMPDLTGLARRARTTLQRALVELAAAGERVRTATGVLPAAAIAQP